ncbi:MAG TPA: YrhK family protein [Stackebrandtia sp.]|jgi:hypothetical protein|uniref:YrhK family protein n=1 Tax=Stackebrandtia sp. TaxID=2023065 RepID=UPI002D72A6B9|nr:YrhK family protein [Stackebrandtia sp.]HZE40020.1 YrhK family protein [Stackebrandtia sp.]
MSDRELVLTFGHEELVIRKRYEALGIVNDLLIAAWFLIGSFFFFSTDLTYAGTWLFVLGSAQLLVRPVIRLARLIHLGRLRERAKQAGAPSRATVTDSRASGSGRVPR